MLKLRQYWSTATLAATGYVGDSPLFFLGYGLRFARVAVLLALWRTLFAGRGAESGMTLGAVLAYTLLAEIFAEPLAGQTELAWLIFQGDLATRFLRPLGVVEQLTAETVGRWAVGLALFSLPLLLAAPLLGVDPRPAGPVATLLSGAILPLALFPWGLGNVFAWLPFAAMASAPLRIYTGTGDPVALLVSQVAWAVVLWPAAGWVWRVNREKLAGYGG
jgi:ABC-type uncharacterized transport system permease subunit